MTESALDARLDSTAAELRSIVDWMERQRERVGSMAEPFLGTDRDDVVSVLHEAERQISVATRAVTRSLRAVEAPR